MSAALLEALSTTLRADYEAVAGVLRSGRSFLLTGHRGPDGDTLGSALALALALKGQGKDARVVFRDPVPSSLGFLPGLDEVVVSHALPADWAAHTDALIACECPEAARMGFETWNAGNVVNLDHHPGNQRYGSVNLVDLSAAAAGEVVTAVLDLLEWPITLDIATNLWVSLVTDTGSFRFGNTTPRALALGARLLSIGVKPGEVNERLFESQPVATVRLAALVLPTLELHAGGRVATLEMPTRYLEESGASPADAEGFANRARAIEGVRAGVFLSERKRAGVVSCSFRSKGTVDVRSVAASLGGGGHRNAAGCELTGTLAEAKAIVLPLLAAAVEAA